MKNIKLRRGEVDAILAIVRLIQDRGWYIGKKGEFRRHLINIQNKLEPRP